MRGYQISSKEKLNKTIFPIFMSFGDKFKTLVSHLANFWLLHCMYFRHGCSCESGTSDWDKKFNTLMPGRETVYILKWYTSCYIVTLWVFTFWDYHYNLYVWRVCLLRLAQYFICTIKRIKLTNFFFNVLFTFFFSRKQLVCITRQT